MLRKLISILNVQGIKTNDHSFALAETEKELMDLGYNPVQEVDETAFDKKYLGVKLEGRVICYAAGNDKEELISNGYEADDDIEFIIRHGAHLWKKTYGYDKLVKPFGY